MDSFSFTDSGGREENQDAVGIAELESTGFYIVADGLGGHRLGNMASQTVVASMKNAWSTVTAWNEAQFQGVIEQANNAVLALQKEKQCNAKSTVVALSIRDGQAIWANSGDSRLYYISNNHIEAITEDHSVAYMKYKTGEITREQIAWDEDQSTLLRALGNQSRWKPNISQTVSIYPGDAFFLCSDGIWEYVSDEEIRQSFIQTGTAEEWAKKLLGLTESRFKQNHDNFSLITVRVED